MKTIDVTEYGSNDTITVFVHHIKYLKSITYTNEPEITVTIIAFIDGTEVHASDYIEDIKNDIM